MVIQIAVMLRFLPLQILVQIGYITTAHMPPMLLALMYTLIIATAPMEQLKK